jgi:hypothetical protein
VLEDLTVGDLRQALDGLPDDALVRVESQTAGVSESIGFMYSDAGGYLHLVLAHLCCPHLR